MHEIIAVSRGPQKAASWRRRLQNRAPTPGLMRETSDNVFKQVTGGTGTGDSPTGKSTTNRVSPSDLPSADAGASARVAGFPQLTEQQIKASMRIITEMRVLLRKLEKLWEEPDYATGHAYIIFQYEETRNAFIKQTRAMTAPRPTLFRRFIYGATLPAPLSGKTVLPHSAAGKSCVQVLTAPEPSDVIWENLELDDNHEVRWLRRGAVLIFWLQCISLTSIIGVRARDARASYSTFMLLFCYASMRMHACAWTALTRVIWMDLRHASHVPRASTRVRSVM